MIKGQLVNLRAHEPEDLEATMAWINDREVTMYLSGLFRFPISRASEKQWLEKATRGDDPSNRMFVIQSKDGTYLGSIGLHHIDYINGLAELGIVIGRKDYWGKGHGRDAVRTLLRFAFLNLRLRKVYLKVFAFNERAIACYRKLGFKEVGRLRQHELKDGVFHDEIYMEVFADEFQGS